MSDVDHPPRRLHMSPACAANEHDSCDGTAFGNAAADKAFMASVPDDMKTCDCTCHERRAAGEGYGEA